MENDLKLYTLEEVSEIVGVTVRTLYKYINDGRLKAVKMGNKWQVSHKNLKDFIEGK